MFSIALIFISWARPFALTDITRRKVDEAGPVAETMGRKVVIQRKRKRRRYERGKEREGK